MKGRDCAATQQRSIDIDFDQCTIRKVSDLSLFAFPDATKMNSR
jgi:hypothetical protein